MSCPSTSSGLKTSSTAISAAPGRLRGVMVEADGTNAATVVIYDNASAASGTELAKVIVDAGLTFEKVICDVVANNGIYLSVSGTGCKAIVLYDRG